MAGGGYYMLCCCVFGALCCLLMLSHTGLALEVSQFAQDYAPYLRFDQKEGDGDRCFPHNASDYYNTRLAGDWSRQCNQDYNTISSAQIPTYWHAQTCGYHLHIAYWSFYGYNHDCDCCSGERDAWWEFLVIKVRDWELSPHLHEVMFGQKKGWYTRIPGHYETHNITHPVAYVGKTNHGNYHDDGGTGTCCYYEDFRNTGDKDQHMKTWFNLVELRQGNGEGVESWMSDPSTDVWNGQQVPTFRSDWDLCDLTCCTGSSLILCGTCGCFKSDLDDSHF
ncbi:hypothetical protein Pmani_039919 [Petrolisthes manimaculis]|uniref:Uncharacterized protein n=1 Tax=Petrolisthes manimaculis TaxID=1843537 RepID=A0AAE1TJ42_9EUCA|nr:hypothetical protein Pmani_039919 [Petrolisthes manimaculis]